MAPQSEGKKPQFRLLSPAVCHCWTLKLFAFVQKVSFSPNKTKVFSTLFSTQDRIWTTS